MRFHIRTYGCQMNERDSESVSSLLPQHGYTPARDEHEADIVIVNTCSVRGKAEDKALGKLRLLVCSKDEHAGRTVGAIGCMAQRLKEEIFRRVPGLDFALGPQRLFRLPEILERVLAGHGPILDVEEGDGQVCDLSGHVRGAVSGFVNILFGCDRRCSYCVVPFVRGRERSRSASEILEEIRTMAGGGTREVTLLGQSVMSYGRRNPVWPTDSVSPRGFSEPLPRLLEAVSRIDGIYRIRFTSGHPSGCTPELAQAMVEVPAVCEHLHLPLQSGSDRVLKMMRRGYTVDEYRRAVDRIRKAVPCLAVSTDIIVGFPSETSADYEATVRLCDEIGFDNAFIFKYSPRPNTTAAEWVDDIPFEEKLRRNKALLVRQDERSLRINEGLNNSVQEVLVEGPSLRDPERWAGRTRTNKIVIFHPAEGIAAGDPVRVRIDRVRPQTLYGTIEEGPRA